MMEEVFESFGAADKNFVEQFQTTAFDARVFELFLQGYFTNSGFQIERASERPDYLVTRDGLTVAVEATTANPTDVPGAHRVPKVVSVWNAPRRTVAEIKERGDHEIPIRFGSALYSKLKKRYWDLPHVRGRPLVIAIEGFDAQDALLFSSAGLTQYLYGLRQSFRRDGKGQLLIDTEPVTVHRLGEKEIPSQFFALPEAEHISAVLFTNSGIFGKFTRMGYQAGLHRGNVLVMRRGLEYDPDPDAALPQEFAYRLDEVPGEEPWGSGIEIFHNPRAVHPVPREFFVDAVQTYVENEAPVSYMPPFVPMASITASLYLDYDSLRPVEHREDGVGTILRREFEARNLVRPAYGTEEFPFGEVAWFSDSERSTVGTVLRWHGQEQYGYVVLRPDPEACWRAVQFDDGLPSLDAAAQEICRHIRQIAATGGAEA
jgi:hypothetical protein